MGDEKKSSYFNMSEAVDEFNHGSYGAGEKTVAGLKIFGKGLFNVARYAVAEVLPGALESGANQVLKNKDLTDEQRSKAEDAKAQAAAVRKRFNGDDTDN
jgi:hypothetical protein